MRSLVLKHATLAQVDFVNIEFVFVQSKSTPHHRARIEYIRDSSRRRWCDIHPQLRRIPVNRKNVVLIILIYVCSNLLIAIKVY